MDEIDLSDLSKFGKFIYQRTRKGYIGKEIIDQDGIVYEQTEKGRPIGVMMAYMKDGQIKFGASFVNQDDKFNVKTGLELAFKDSLKTKNFNFNKFNKNKEMSFQFKEFVRRAARYFYPDEYSYKKGRYEVDDLVIDINDNLNSEKFKLKECVEAL